jgi:arabinogalactan oligomer/maltooligosaccharide transport system permease protein
MNLQSFSHRRRFAVGLLIGLGVAIAILMRVLSTSRAEEAESKAQRLGILKVLSVSEVVHEVGMEGDDIREAIAEIARQSPSLRMIRVVRGVMLVASTSPGDSGDKAAPRRLARDEKEMFDLGQRLRAAVQTNRDEGVPRKEEIEISGAPSRGLLLAAPVEEDDAITGYVQIELAPQKVAPEVDWIMPLVAWLVPVLLFLALSGRIGERRLAIASVATTLFVISLGWYAIHAGKTLESDWRATEQSVADLLQKEGDRVQSILEALAILPATPPRVSSWDADVFRRPRGLISETGAINESKLAADLKSGVDRLRKTVLVSGIFSLMLVAFFGFGVAANFAATFVKYRQAYAYTAPALIGMIVLVFFPFLYGIILSFTGSSLYNTDKSIPEIWIGLRNYFEILGDLTIIKRTPGGVVPNFINFYYTLLFTILWTVSNVAIGVSVGLLLALVLNTKGLALRPLYRVLLIFPWAMPSYITALTWKGMFHQQFGVINQVVQLFGGDPISWFEKPFTSYLTVLTTNGWLSFPFMMVVSLGALQSISGDLYEAARVDGATRWQQFRSITLPSLKPALIPAIILSVVWTFNQFNVIFLVSGGQPAGSTEILITQAYKIAFEQYRYGYAAAYSTIIFVILLMYGVIQNRVTRATEAIAG